MLRLIVACKNEIRVYKHIADLITNKYLKKAHGLCQKLMAYVPHRF